MMFVLVLFGLRLVRGAREAEDVGGDCVGIFRVHVVLRHGCVEMSAFAIQSGLQRLRNVGLRPTAARASGEGGRVVLPFDGVQGLDFDVRALQGASGIFLSVCEMRRVAASALGDFVDQILSALNLCVVRRFRGLRGGEHANE